MAARRGDAHQSAARGANFWPGLLIASTKKSTHRASPTIQGHLPTIGKRQFSSLRTRMPRSYNTGVGEIVRVAGSNSAAGAHMDKFEEIGQRLDQELTRLRRYVEEEVAPGTERRTARFLREVSELLTDAAAKLESRNAARESQPAKDAHS
jgi:hypothetical protein